VVDKGARPRARARGAKRLAKRRAFMVLAAVQNVRRSIVLRERRVMTSRRTEYLMVEAVKGSGSSSLV
jgi:hypothetical protein